MSGGTPLRECGAAKTVPRGGPIPLGMVLAVPPSLIVGGMCWYGGRRWEKIKEVCMEGNCLLVMRGISKVFGSNRVLVDIDLTLQRGEIVSLLGENGAGKSTLIKILGGIYAADGGEICIDGEKKHITTAAAARENGVRIIHQEIVLVPHRTIAANIFLGREPRTALGLVDYKKMVRETGSILEEFGIDLDPDAMVCDLSLGHQQQVEIVKAVSANAKIVVMDEPTSSLSEGETEILFRIIEKLKNKGVGIIYISHRLDELFKISDRIMVLRDGMMINTVPVETARREELINMMVGRVLDQYYVKTKNKIRGMALEVKKLENKKLFHDINFNVHYGEIVGFSGLVGAGRTEVMKSCFGAIPHESGQVFLEEREVSIKRPRDAMRAGIAYVPEDRRGEGLVLLNDVEFNMGLANIRNLVKGVHVRKNAWKRIVREYVEKFRIKITSPQQKTGRLSGGNQQKVVLGKWLAIKPKVIILDEPTRGIDVGSKAEIYSIINDLAAQGTAIIIVSSDLPEIINMCDRAYIMSEGHITGELTAEEFSQERIMTFSTTTKTASRELVEREG